MSNRSASLASATAWLLAAGLTVGLIVGHWAAGSGQAVCASGTAGLACLELTQTLAVRAGLFAGTMTMVVLLSSAGMLRMTVLDERRRAVMAREARTSEWAGFE